LEDLKEELQALLIDSCRIRLRADVPVGAYLSGGIDSTYTSALVKRHFNNRLCTFSVAFANAAFDETPFQEEAIQSLGTEHRTVRCTDADIADSFPDVVWHAETPMLRTAPAPLFRLSGLVRSSAYKVVLTGEGADEIFAGYNIFKEAKVRRFWARFPESNMRPRLLERLYPYIFSGDNEKAKGYLKGFYRKGLENVGSPVYSHLPRWENTAQLQPFLSNPEEADGKPLDRFITNFSRSLPEDFLSWPPLTRAQYIEMKIFLSNYLLSTQGDRMTMAHSVEGRYPFLDHRVIEFAFKLPVRYRLNGLTEKFILKKIAKGVIPDRLVNRPKQPYRAPISSVFFGEKPTAYVDDLLSEDALVKSGYFDPQRVARLTDKCRRSAQGLTSERENMALVGILSTQLMHHQFIDNFPKTPKTFHADITYYGET
jgi:asparagine synthase (glutamine-hydrolysing)